MKEITAHADIMQLVSSFYSRIRKHETLGPIFNTILPTDAIWEKHLEKLTDFWETNLFHVIKFKGNPMEAHQRTDKANEYKISQDHFYLWLMLWNKNIDSQFFGEKAKLAKEKARRLSTHLFVNVQKKQTKNY